MQNEPDPRLIKLVRELSEERQRRVKAEGDLGRVRGVSEKAESGTPAHHGRQAEAGAAGIGLTAAA